MKFSRLKLFLSLFVLGMFGAVAVLPYAFSTISIASAEPLPLTVRSFVTLQMLLSAVLLLLAIVVGGAAARRVGLGAPYLEKWCGIIPFRSVYARASADPFAEPVLPSFPLTIILGASVGIAAAAVTIALDAFAFHATLGVGVSRGILTPLWQRALAVLYGGVNEEMIMRLGILSSIAWMLQRAERRTEAGLSAFGRWASIVLTALLFSVGHLPFAADLALPDGSVVLRVLLLNGVAAMFFGWIYWKRGLGAAMTAHLVSDSMLLLLLPWASVRWSGG